MNDTVKLIIEMPKQVYELCKTLKSDSDDGIIGLCAVNAIANGTPLPKGHGRIGDLDALREEVSSWGMNDYEPSDFTYAIDQADAIIEADKESEVSDKYGNNTK